MKKTDTPRKTSPGRSAKQEGCTDAPCDSGLRNQYFEGKRLTADSFRVEQSYLLERRRLLNRAIHGWGVVYGYAMKPVRDGKCRTEEESGSLEIGPGLALDECGRELLLARAASLSVNNVILLDGKGARRMERPPEGSYEPYDKQQHGEKRPQACWLLSAHYAEQLVGPMTVKDPCSCERSEWENVCETVRFSLRRVDCEECCADFDCELECGCGTGPCCQQHTEESPRSQVDQDKVEKEGEQYESTEHRGKSGNPVHRGGCQCLCEYLTGLSDAECGGLCEIDDPCVHIRADLRHGVPLACVRLREDDCDNWVFDRWFEACGPRRLVKRNDALFDLIRGCDLTRISAVGWADWHRSTRPVHWDDFQASFGEETGPQSGLNLTSKYWVEFSRPVRKDTVRADCFLMTVIVYEDEAGWGEARRVPILDVDTSAATGTPAGFVTRATLVVDAGWVDDATESRKTIFNRNAAAVEIEIRGDFIVDCNGQTIDANAIGLSPGPTGNGTPGGTFISTFHVQARDSESRPAGYDTTHRAQGV
jgi:hypothetical protein